MRSTCQQMATRLLLFITLGPSIDHAEFISADKFLFGVYWYIRWFFSGSIEAWLTTLKGWQRTKNLWTRLRRSGLKSRRISRDWLWMWEANHNGDWQASTRLGKGEITGDFSKNHFRGIQGEITVESEWKVSKEANEHILNLQYTWLWGGDEFSVG